MSRIRDAAVAALWLLPSTQAKREALARFGHVIHPTAVARPNLVWRVGRVELGPGSRLGLLNTLKNMRSVSLGAGARVGRLNVISSHPVYRRLYPDGAALTLAADSTVTSRHSLDCAGGLSIGEMSLVAGRGSLFLTHSIDPTRDAQVAHPITVGARTFVSARCTVLGGATLPDRSIFAAGAVVARSREPRTPGLYAGVPARRIGDASGSWYDRSASQTRRVYVPATGETIEDAF